jgi:hypothetical protein
MKLQRRQILELRWAINQLSNLNKETGFQVYDLGFPAHIAMARTLAILKPALSKIEERQQQKPEVDMTAFLNEEIELDVAKFKVAEVKCGGMAPSPEILALLAPIME